MGVGGLSVHLFRNSMPDEVPFTSEEAASIREAFATPGAVRCPRCGEVLRVKRSPEGDLLTLSCQPCRRILVLRHEG